MNLESAQILISPTPPEGSMWINGKPVSGTSVSVPLGTTYLHLTSAPSETLTLEVSEAGEFKLLLANRLPPDALGWVSDDKRNGQLEALFLSSFSANDTMYAVTNGAVWSHMLGTSKWQLLAEAGGASQSAIEESTRYAREPRRTGVITAGISGTSVGFALGVFAAAMHSINQQNQANANLEDLDTHIGNQDNDTATIAQDLSEQSLSARKKIAPQLITGGVFATVGGLGIIVSTKMFRKTKARRALLPDWHPYAIAGQTQETDPKVASPAPASEEAALEAAPKSPPEPSEEENSDPENTPKPAEEAALEPAPQEAAPEPSEEARSTPESAPKLAEEAAPEPPAEPDPEQDN